MGPALVEKGTLGCHERQCDQRSLKKYIEDQKPEEPDDNFKVV